MTDTSPLSPKVLKQLTRLKGRVPDDFTPVERTVDTPVGPRPVPPSVQALLAVSWPAKHVLLTKDEFAWEVHIPSEGETDKGLVREVRAWYAVGYDEGQWYILVDLDEAAGSDDPPTYRVDHEGDEPVPWAKPLSERLAGLKVKRPPAKKYDFARACAAGDLAAVEEFIAGGASLGPVNAAGLTPLHLAAHFSREPAVVRRLIEAGADVNATITKKILDLRPFADADRVGDNNLFPSETPLYCAFYAADGRFFETGPMVTEMMRMLLEAGADPNAPDRSGEPLLMSVAGMRNEDGVDLLRLLLDAGAELEPLGLPHGPLHKAAYGGSARMVEALLAEGLDPCRRSERRLRIEGPTPLHLAVMYGDHEILRILVAAARDVDVRTVDGITPLHSAACSVRTEPVRTLLEAGADPRARLDDPKTLGDELSEAHTPLEIARELGRGEVAAVIEEFLT